MKKNATQSKSKPRAKESIRTTTSLSAEELHGVAGGVRGRSQPVNPARGKVIGGPMTVAPITGNWTGNKVLRVTKIGRSMPAAQMPLPRMTAEQRLGRLGINRPGPARPP